MIGSVHQAAWIAALAFVVALFTFTAIKNSQPRLAKQEQHAGPQDGTAEIKQHDSKAGVSENTKSLPGQTGKGADHSSAEKENTDAALALYTYYLTFFTAVLAAGTIVLAIATIGLWGYAAEQASDMKESIEAGQRSADAAKESADIAKATLVSANRPWISAEFQISSDLTFEASGARLTIEYTMKNTGNAPAVRVEAYPKFMLLELGKVSGTPPDVVIQSHQTDAAAELISVCRTARTIADAQFAAPITGDTIFPNAVLTDRVTVTLTMEEIERAREMSFYKIINPILLVCLNYRSPLENTSHQTGYIFYITSQSPVHDKGIDPTKGNIPAGYLGIMRFPFRSSIAN